MTEARESSLCFISLSMTPVCSPPSSLVGILCILWIYRMQRPAFPTLHFFILFSCFTVIPKLGKFQNNHGRGKRWAIGKRRNSSEAGNGGGDWAEENMRQSVYGKIRLGVRDQGLSTKRSVSISSYLSVCL